MPVHCVAMSEGSVLGRGRAFSAVVRGGEGGMVWPESGGTFRPLFRSAAIEPRSAALGTWFVGV